MRQYSVDGLSVQQAAEELSLHPKTVRQRIKDGRLPAQKVLGSHGPEWRVFPDGGPSADGGLTVDSPSADPPSTVDSPSVQGESHEAIVEALRLVDRLQRDNQQLAGQVGFLQARVQDQERQIALLMAPKEDEPAGEPMQPRHRWWEVVKIWKR